MPVDHHYEQRKYHRQYYIPKVDFQLRFWIRVEIHPQVNPKAFQLLDIDELHPLFKSLATALLNYYEIPEPHLNEFQLYVYGELVDHLSYIVG